MSGLASRQRAARKFRSNAERMLAREDAGIALDFTDESFQSSNERWGSVFVKDNVTLANNFHGSPFDLLTYTSPSAKMTLGPRGILQFRPHNLAVQSEAFNTTWTTTAASVSANTSTAPNGTLTADTLSETAVTNEHNLRQTISYVSGMTYRWSVYAKAGTVGFMQMWVSTTAFSSALGINFDLTNGAVGSSTGPVVSSGIENVGDGWYRCWYTAVATSTTTAATVVGIANSSTAARAVSYAGNASNNILLWGFQVDQQPAPFIYVPTTTAARYGLPYEWDTEGKLRGLLVEEARTNLCLRSNDLTNASWTKSNMTTSLTATGPDGVANSATICTATAGNATALQAITSGSAARVTSVWLKRRTGTGNIDLTQDNGSTWTTQTLTSSWQRFELASVTSTNPTVGIRIVTSGDEVDVYGFQHELGTFASSLIPTVAASVTRAIDNKTQATSSTPYLATAGTLVLQGRTPSGTGTQVALQIDDGTENERYRIVRDSSNNLRFIVTDGGVEQANLNLGTVGNSTQFRVAVAWSANDIAGSLNGGTIVTDASATLPTVTTFRVGRSFTGENFNGHLQVANYTPRRTANADLVELARLA